MAINTMLAAKMADYSRGRETPGLWSMVKVVVSAQAQTVDLTTTQIECAISELARMGKGELAERLAQAAR